jgi:hypothetical protein
MNIWQDNIKGTVCDLDSSGSGYDAVKNSCKHGNELFSSIKSKRLDELSKLLRHQSHFTFTSKELLNHKSNLGSCKERQHGQAHLTPE